jgi:Protein of unknown function (DUF3726)
MDLSLNEAESLSAKAARGAGFAWGLADDVGRAARGLAQAGGDWSGALLVLLARAQDFAPPSARRIALWRAGLPDAREAAALCPVRTAAWFNDAPTEIGAAALELLDVGLPIWLDALLKAQGLWRVETDLAAARAVAKLMRGDAPTPVVTRRATVAHADFAALNVYAARNYVPESIRSRAQGAGGDRVDNE